MLCNFFLNSCTMHVEQTNKCTNFMNIMYFSFIKFSYMFRFVLQIHVFLWQSHTNICLFTNCKHDRGELCLLWRALIGLHWHVKWNTCSEWLLLSGVCSGPTAVEWSLSLVITREQHMLLAFAGAAICCQLIGTSASSYETRGLLNA
jgi:hypothetical protein